MLRQKARKVRGIDRSIGRLADDMMETMYAAYGVGLAAPQVGIPLRVVVLELEEDRVEVLINPEVVKRKGERIVDEGCLSIPGYRGKVRRSEKVWVKGYNLQGRELKLRVEDLPAQALEHEIDHLNGVLYIDHLVEKDGLYRLEEEGGNKETPL
jgi:peptide deformylase